MRGNLVYSALSVFESGKIFCAYSPCFFALYLCVAFFATWVPVLLCFISHFLIRFPRRSHSHTQTTIGGVEAFQICAWLFCLPFCCRFFSGKNIFFVDAKVTILLLITSLFTNDFKNQQFFIPPSTSPYHPHPHVERQVRKKKFQTSYFQ